MAVSKENKVRLNIRGRLFITDNKALQSVPNTLLSNLSKKSEFYDESDDSYFFDRNSDFFQSVLDFYSTITIHIPKDICPRQIRKEMVFWKIPFGAVDKCCWKTLYEIEDDMDVLDSLLLRLPIGRNTEEQQQDHDKLNLETGKQNPKVTIWKFLTDHNSSKSALIWQMLLVLTVILSTIFYALQSSTMFRVKRTVTLVPINQTIGLSSKEIMYFQTEAHPVLFYGDILCNSIFTIEWILRWVTCPSKIKFMTTFLNITDLVSTIAVWLILFIGMKVFGTNLAGLNDVCSSLGFLYTLRVFRLFRIAQHICAFQILMLSVRSTIKELIILCIIFSCAMIIFAGLIYAAEIKSESFGNIFISMWWSLITMTTVGYGDYTPTNITGYMIGSTCALVGILLIALPVAITSSSFNNFYRFNKYRLLQLKEIGIAIQPKLTSIGSYKIYPITDVEETEDLRNEIKS